ncbi:hypothetical protein [Fructilactobacillus fructivorans]|uniref:hypothetical protein n=2 Tax=Fructilactobacillus fructivorans TaxID=1614 RepID=UPI000AA7B7F9|nr:hypothetical protein [Fructilactobacillus fructivorans]
MAFESDTIVCAIISVLLTCFLVKVHLTVLFISGGCIIEYSNTQWFIYKLSELLSNKLLILLISTVAFVILVIGYILIRSSSHHDKIMNHALNKNHKKMGIWLVCIGILFIGLFFVGSKYVKKIAISPDEITRTNKINFSEKGTISNIDPSNGNYVYEIRFNNKNKPRVVYISALARPVPIDALPPIQPFSGTFIEQSVISHATLGSKVMLRSYKYDYKYKNHKKFDPNDHYSNQQLKLLNENYVNGVVTEK